MTYATVTDLAARWRPISSSEEGLAETLLEDAALRIDRACPPPETLTDDDLRARKIVACEMVKRAMVMPDNLLGVTSYSDGTGPFQEQRTYGNPMGNLYLTKEDRRLLGCGGQQIGTIPFRAEPPPVWPWGL